MLKNTTKEFRTLFLLKFTKELIENSSNSPFFKIASEVKELEEEEKYEQEKLKKEITKRIENKTNNLETFSVTKSFKPLPQSFKIVSSNFPQKRVLRIPQPRLPPHLQYLKPFPTNTEIDLGKINPLIQDIAVKIIECNGKDEPIIVKGRMGEKTTSISLSEEEITGIIQSFTQAGKIPYEDGIINLVVGRLKLSAIISEITGSKFIINKM